MRTRVQTRREWRDDGVWVIVTLTTTEGKQEMSKGPWPSMEAALEGVREVVRLAQRD
jgi:hypothetical protein